MTSRSSFHGDSLFDQTNRLATRSLGDHAIDTFGAHRISDPSQGTIIHSAGIIPAMRAANSLRVGQQHRDNQQHMARHQRRAEAQFHQWAIRKGQAQQQIRSIPTPASFSIGRSRTDSGRLRDERAEQLRSRLPVTMSAAQAARLANELNPPREVERVDTAEEFEKLPTGTLVKSGRYSGIKLAEVNAYLHNGVVIRTNGKNPLTNRDYRLYIMEKYPYSAAFHLTNPGRYGPFVPLGVAINGSVGVNSIFGSMSAGGGLAFNSYQLAPYASWNAGGGTPVTRLQDIGFGWSLSISLIDATSELTDNHNLSPVQGLSLGHTVNAGPLALGYSQSMYYNDNHKFTVDPRGFTNYTLGMGGGFNYRRELSNSYILAPSGEPITIHQLPK